MASVDVSSINKFNGQNYSQWRFQINCALKAKGVYAVVSGDSNKPENDAAKIEKWIREDAVAMFTISSAMELSQVTLIESCSSSKEMMEKLDSIFKLKSDFNKMLLLDKFHQMKMENNETVVQYIAKIENLAHQIKESGENISDATIITKILGTLPSKYRNFRQAWLSVDDSKQILSNLTARLIDEETSLSQSELSESAFYAFNRSKPEHKKHSNYFQEKENKYKNQSKSVDKSKITCYACRRKGHFARDCRSKPREKSDFIERSKSSSNYSAFSSEIKTTALESEESWILDSGASAHMTYNLSYFHDFVETNENESIRLGNNLELPIKGRGNIKILRELHGEWQQGEINNVLYIPDLKKSLLSEGVIASKGMKIIKMHDRAEIYNCKDELVGTAKRSTNNLYHMLFKTLMSPEVNVSSKNDLKVWHERTGHVNVKTLSELSKRGLIEKLDMSNKEEFFCEGCQYGKQHRFSFSPKEYKATKPAELIHSDICGPMSVQSVGGANYFILMKDDFSGFRNVYFLKHKSDALAAFQNFVQLCENKFSHRVKALRVDNGKEYINSHFSDYLNKKGIQLEPTAPYTPQQNGRSERDMRTIVESARSMMYSKELPLYLWAEAVNTAVYILNRTPTTQAPNSTPYELWTGKSASLSHLKIFGSEAYVHVPDNLRKKLEPKSKKMIFVGYEKESKNYRLFDPITKHIKVSRDVIFNEENTNFKTSPQPSTFLFTFNEDSENDKDLTDESPNNLPESSDPNRNADHYGLRPRNKIKVPARYELNVTDIITPNTYEEAMSSPQADKWKEAIHEELNSLEKNKTWDLVPLPESANIIGSKWVFKVKYLPNGNIERFKARLCAKGFSQVEGVDFSETFSPTSRFDTIRVLLAIAAQRKWEVVQIDVKTAFLHGEVEETIFMEPPPGLDYSKDLVCRLKKSLYGLKQASRCWNKTFSEFLTNFGFKQSIADPCVFNGIFQSKKVLLIIYVDDALLFCEEKEILIKIVEDLRKKFEATICETGQFVGMEIEYRSDGSIFIHSKNYINRILKRFNLDDASPSTIPADPGTILSSESSPFSEGRLIPYREAIGSLMFLSTTTRPDIAFAVNVVSRFQANPGQVHWNAIKRIFRYLKGTATHGIEYSPVTDNLCHLVGYSDADFANDTDTRKSTSGYVFKISNGPVTWCSQKQSTVSTSTTEAEYIAASTAVKEILWLRQLLNDAGESEICEGGVALFMDNQSAIKLIKNPVFHKRTKHIDVRYHFIREKYDDGSVSIKYIKSEEQLADIFTKALPKAKFEKLRDLLNIKEIM